MSVKNSVFGGDDEWVWKALHGFLSLVMVFRMFQKYIHGSKINHIVFNKIIGEFYEFELCSLL